MKVAYKPLIYKWLVVGLIIYIFLEEFHALFSSEAAFRKVSQTKKQAYLINIFNGRGI